MVPVPWLVDRYAEDHPAYTDYQDAWGYANRLVDMALYISK
jgi:hypothetical protein